MTEILDALDSIANRKAKALTLVRTIHDSHIALLSSLSACVDMLWDDADPQTISDELGVHAAAVFAASSAATTCLEAVCAGCTNTILAKVGTFTVNSDGTVTNLVKPT